MPTNARSARIYTGDIAAAVGLDHTVTGDTLCDEEHPIVLEAMEFPAPVISLSIKPKSRGDRDKIGKGLMKLSEEDPTFTVSSDKETDETILSGMGELHLEVIVDRLKHEFNVEAVVGMPKVAYKETILKTADINHKHVKQTGGKGQYAHVVINLSPADPGAGFEFIDSIVGGRIPKEYIPAVEKGIIDAMQNGVYAGYPVVDVKVDLVDGSFHEVDSSEMAFRTAAREAFKKAFMRAAPVFLEPFMSVEVTTPDEFVGGIVGDICSRRGRVLGMEAKGKTQIISAEAPLGEMFGYATGLRSLSSGRANYSMHFEKYIEVPNSIAEKILEEFNKAKEERDKKNK
jgi:elongation factor G